jgi:hypothetical protein
MKRTGLALIELLLAIAIGLAVMGGAFLTLRQAARSLSTEQKVALSQDQGARVLQGLSGELKDRPAAFLLPGASDQGAGVVALVGNGWPVIPDGYGSQKVRIVGGAPDLKVGAPAVLVSPTGEVFYIDALASITPIDTTAGVYELDFGNNCGNPLSFVQGMRVYKADTLVITKTSEGLQIEGASLGKQQVVALKDFTLRFVYSSPEKETLSPTYQGASLPDGSRLTALAFQATGTTEASRAYTARIPLISGTVEVRNVTTCGSTSSAPPAGTGVVTIVVNPAPPGGGDVTLSASGYTRTTHTTYTFSDVPVGDVEVQSKVVWSDSLTAWTPDLSGGPDVVSVQRGTLHTYAPLSFTVSYHVVPAILQVEVTPSFQGAIRLLGLPGNPTVSAPKGSLQVPPGQYSVTAESPVGGTSPEGCLTRYVADTPPQTLTLRSYGTYTLALEYHAESGCLDITVQDRTQGNALMNAGYKPTVRFKTVP